VISRLLLSIIAKCGLPVFAKNDAQTKNLSRSCVGLPTQTCLVIIASAIAPMAWADNGHHGGSAYAGEESRAISSLSAADMADLRDGKGWGFAKPAELNGYPGPLHVLQLGDKLGLTVEQRRQVQAIFDQMAASARETGTKFVEAERALDVAFKSRAVDSGVLQEKIAAAETLRAELRRIHLAAHLETTPILTAQQRHAYSALRGYNTDHMPSHGHHHTPKAE
jgi:Spy/CpxP family protein refolding chaperone